MKYISTRGKAPALSFEEVLLAGLASDGGLYVPEFMPRFTIEQMNALRSLSYDQLAIEIMYPFVEGCIPRGDFTDIVEETYDSFDHVAIAPLKQVAANDWMLELFHGPTLAFKDFALQLLGRLVNYVLEKRQQRVAILGPHPAIRGLPRLRDVVIPSGWMFSFFIRMARFQKCSVGR